MPFFKSRLLDDPADMLARNELNQIYLDQGLTVERRKLLEETVSFDTALALALYEYAMILEKEGKIDAAIDYLEGAEKKERHHSIVHALARLKRETGHYSEAVSYYEMALVDVSDPLPILEKISECYHFLNDHVNCVVVISRALLLGATGKSWWHNLYFALKELGIDRWQYIDFLSGKLSGGKGMSDQEIKAKLVSLTGMEEP